MARFGGATEHPLAALLGFATFVLFFVSGLVYYGYLDDFTALTVADWQSLGVVALITAIFAYWWEDSYR